MNRIKSGKQPGPDWIKGEIIKWLKDEPICLEELTRCLNLVVKNNKVPENWKVSKTVMIPKTQKPKVMEYRPIALQMWDTKY